MASSTPQRFARPRRVSFLGCPMDLMTSAEFLDEAAENIRSRGPCRVVQFVNANKVAKSSEDSTFAQTLWQADYVFTDGQPMLPLARLLGIRVPERIDGIGLMSKMLTLADQHRFRVYLLGAKQDILESCVSKISADYPNLVLAGHRNGYFKAAETPRIVNEIAESKADILFLGMGSPLKEYLANEIRNTCGVRIIQGVGGSFDVMAGLVKRAPVWMQNIGMEWFYRVLQEPRRMAWRYATTNAQCLGVFFTAFANRIVGRAEPQVIPTEYVR